jgi:hypothetical protein
LPKTAAPIEDTVLTLLRTTGHEVAAATICQAWFVESSSLRRIYELIFSNGRLLALLIPLASMLRLLRLERRIINFEAAVIQWLSTVLYQHKSQLVDPGSQEEKEEAEEAKEKEETEVERKDQARERAENVENDQEEAMKTGKGSPTNKDREGPRKRSSSTGGQQNGVRCSLLEGDLGLLHLLPQLAHYFPSSESLGAPCTSWQPRSTKTLASLTASLTAKQRSDVDYDLGKINHCFSRLTSPNGRFGYAGPIIACCHAGPSSSLNGTISWPLTPAKPAEGCTTWSEAFNLMLEDILRDAEDMAISIPYPVLRKHCLYLSHRLDEVTEPRLVFIDGVEDTNVLITSAEEEDGQYEAKDESEDEESVEENEDESDDSVQDGPRRSPCLRKKRHNKNPTATTSTPQIVFGFRNWSNAIFGDPLIAKVFSNNPPSSFLDRSCHRGSSTSPFASSKTSVHKTTSAEIRLLLYQAYHATVAVVHEFYHPKSDSTTRELAARRKLNDILLRLKQVEERDIDGQRLRPTHRRPSGDMSPAKKLKSVEKERDQRERRRERDEVGSSRRWEVEVVE